MSASNPLGSQVHSLRRRRMEMRVHVLAQVFAMCALVVMVNWLVSRHYVRFDWTRSRYYQLSDKTKQALRALKEPMDVVVFLPPNDERDYVEKALQDVRNLLEEFQFYGKDMLRVEYVDPHRDLAREKHFVEKYKLDSPDVIIFASRDRHKYVRLDELVDLDPAMGTGSPRIRAFKGEGVFLAAMQTVVEEEPPKVYFMTGHGERNPEEFDERNGYSTLAGYIKRDNIIVRQWNLMEKQSLPDDAGAIVVAGPRQAFTAMEIDMLQKYLDRQGRLFLLLDPRQTAGMEPLLVRLGVQADDDLVVAQGGRLLGAELLLVNALGAGYAPHPVTAKLKGVNTTFPYARSVRRVERTSDAADKPRVTELVKTPDVFWGETDPDTQRAVFDAASDLPGPLTLAVAVEMGRPAASSVDIGSARAIVVGTSSFVANGSLTGGNLDFFMNALNWLLRREQLVAVGPRLPEEFRLSMSSQQLRWVYGLVIGGLPLGVGSIGIFVWSRRRR